jgi:hypothetical protein
MRARVGSVPRDRLYPFVSGQAGPSIMMGGTDVLGFPMTHSSENSTKIYCDYR